MLPSLPHNAITQVKEYFLQLQNNICSALASLDNKEHFREDIWQNGRTRTLANGRIFEKAGVNFSHVSGEHLPKAATDLRPELAGCRFNAMGVSLVIHPDNPYIPTAHANVRFFIAERDNTPPVWWFGGGFDLTPYYGFHEDCQHWHRIAHKACEPFGEEVYPRFKSWADDYFYIKHRQEPRGVGGLFFDDFNEHSFEYSFDLTKSIGDHFTKAYCPIVERRHATPFSDQEKTFQCYRRGRYVEFNLIYDRGTLFGLQSGGRIESILMSLPPVVHWRYNWSPALHSAEEKLYSEFLPVRNWLSE